jgi:hypothetical protein
MGAVQIPREGEEVVPVEEGVGAGGVHGLPGFANLAVGRVLLLDLDPTRMAVKQYSFSTERSAAGS